MLLALLCCPSVLLPQTSASRNDIRPHLASLIQVIANPKNFDGEAVKLVGFLGRGGGADLSVGLFVSENDERNHVIPNSIDVTIDESKVKGLIGQCVVLSGVYHAPDPRAGYNGYIDQITDLRVWNSGDLAK